MIYCTTAYCRAVFFLLQALCLPALDSHTVFMCHAFTALCERLTVHLLRLERGIVSQPGREEGSVEESWGGRYRRKRSGFL